jgi:hypothetical protein
VISAGPGAARQDAVHFIQHNRTRGVEDIGALGVGISKIIVEVGKGLVELGLGVRMGDSRGCHPWTGLLRGFRPADRFAPLRSLSRFRKLRLGLFFSWALPRPSVLFKERGGGHSDDPLLSP